MMKKVLVFLFAFVIFAGIVNSISAKTTVKTVAVKVTATPTPTPSPINSFELFWPMSAGKTMQSKVYFLKTLKEKVRGFLIFGSAQKADYDIFLGIKRMLESESLMKGNVADLANKTLDSANNEFNQANSALTNAKNSGDIDQDIKNEINVRVDNLKKFTNYLINTYPTYKDKLQGILDKLNSITV